jgi:hypothetical protein
MSSFFNSPKILKGGIVLIDPESSAVRRIIVLQYNPETLTRTLAVQGTGGEGGSRSEALRIKGPPVETIRLDAEIDATDQLEFPEDNPDAVEHGIQPQLSALETIIYPSSIQLLTNHALAQAGTLEIAPMEAPLSLFIWSKHRIMPVRITDFSITEEAFDPSLNTIRAKVGLGMRVLSVDDLGFSHKGGGLFMSYLQLKEQLAGNVKSAGLNTFGIGGIP